MTEKIYYQDSAAVTAGVAVIDTGIDSKGNFAILDQTCFYPEGGGQPSDTGVIGEVQVTDVQSVDGEIRHYTEKEVRKGEYTAAIDWQRRFDHMQQHTGQHLLSAVFEDTFGMATKSFHLGTERVSIDLDTAGISRNQLTQVEQQVNFHIYKQIPIETEWVTEEQAEKMILRKKPAVEGEIRLVKIADLDINACGGTHLRNTAELGLLKIIRTEKSKSGTRVYFLCGNRALKYFDLLQSMAEQLTKSLNAPVSELAGAATVILNDRKEKEKQIKKLSLQLVKAEADSIQPKENMLIRKFVERPFKEVQQLAKLLVEKHPSAYLFFHMTDESNTRFVCAKGKNVPGDMKEVIQKITGDGVKVGGTYEIAQGSVMVTDDLAGYEEAFNTVVKKITRIL